MLEYEKKILLTMDEYKAIVRLMGENAPTGKQTNYYFDTDDLAMNRKGITCRFREKDGNYKATVKYHDAENPDCSAEEDLIEVSEFDSKIFDAIGLCYQGMLITERVVIHKDAFCEMVIDRNTYLGYTDFELEVEYSKGSEQRAKELLKSVGKTLVDEELVTDLSKFLKRIGQSGSKSQRFFERKQIGGGRCAECNK